jgi:hypothetical protein
MERQQNVQVDSKGTSDGVFQCSGCDAPVMSTDATPLYDTIAFKNSELDLSFVFDSRIAIDWSLASLQKYAKDFYGSVNVLDGALGIDEIDHKPFEVVSYQNGRLRLRIQTTLNWYVYHVAGTDYYCFSENLCNSSYSCVYYSDPSDPVQFTADLEAELELQ